MEIHLSQFEYRMETAHIELGVCWCLILLVVEVAHLLTTSFAIALPFPQIQLCVRFLQITSKYQKCSTLFTFTCSSVFLSSESCSIVLGAQLGPYCTASVYFDRSACKSSIISYNDDICHSSLRCAHYMCLIGATDKEH